jgi:hypothetical protein
VYEQQATDGEFDEHTVHCTDKYAYEQNSSNIAPWRNTVLVLHDDDREQGEEWQDKGTMAMPKVARVHCLFSLNVYSDRQFACVEYFACAAEVEEAS